jgi:hypothetical protein
VDAGAEAGLDEASHGVTARAHRDDHAGQGPDQHHGLVAGLGRSRQHALPVADQERLATEGAPIAAAQGRHRMAGLDEDSRDPLHHRRLA